MTKQQAVVALLDFVEDPDLGPSPALSLGTGCVPGFTRLPSAADGVLGGAVVLRKSSTELVPAVTAHSDTSTSTETGSQKKKDLL